MFAKVYGENAPKDEAEFRARIKAEIEQNMAEDSKYKFGLDAKAAILKKMEKVAFPEAFLRRWVLATNDKMTEEQLDKDFPQMLEELKWHLAKDQLLKAFGIEIQKEDVEAYAKEVARMQFMQYGMMHVEDKYLERLRTGYAQEGGSTARYRRARRREQDLRRPAWRSQDRREEHLARRVWQIVPVIWLMS